MHQAEFWAYVKRRDAEKAKRAELEAAATAERELVSAHRAELRVQGRAEAAERRAEGFGGLMLLAFFVLCFVGFVLIGGAIAGLVGMWVVAGILVTWFLAKVYLS